MEDSSMEAVEIVRSFLQSLRVPTTIIRRALARSSGDVSAAAKLILNDPRSLLDASDTVAKTITATGVRVSARIKEEESSESGGSDQIHGSMSLVRVKDEPVECEVAAEEAGKELCFRVKEEKQEMGMDFMDTAAVKMDAKDEGPAESRVRVYEKAIVPWKIIRGMTFQEYIKSVLEKFMAEQQKLKKSVKKEPSPDVEIIKPKPSQPQVRKINGAVVEDDEFPDDPDWFLVGRNVVNALSTSKGRKLVDNEIVRFAFPSLWGKYNSAWIVRFSTQRSGEVGRLPMEWAKCVGPLVHSGKVKVLGRCVAAPPILHIMQEIMLYVSFYIHRSVFSQTDSSWTLEPIVNGSTTIYPLLNLFKLLDLKPYQKAEFAPENVDSRKRSLELVVQTEEALAICPAPTPKRRRGVQLPQLPQQQTDEQTISESTLNKIVGSADMYDLEEMEPSNTLRCTLKPYQKQALYWMSESEKGVDTEKTLHPAWSAYKICDERAASIYVNIFSGEATTRFPTAKLMARGGILADAMGLGKTVMTIALILSRPCRGSPDNSELGAASVDYSGSRNKRKRDTHSDASPRVKGGTLIVCPMALLGQWNDELATHAKPGSLSVIVYYGGDRTTEPRILSGHDVVLTTYGVLQASYKNGGDNSIFNRVDWYRVVLDEAHYIKNSKSQVAQAAFTLSSQCRWCLTGTPLQNSLDDVYSLLCFLHVEPCCNWPWWLKYIKSPYDNGDATGLKLIKAILRPLMLRRTKETRDKGGRPIVVLPPTDIQTIECEQSEAERDFYDALFRRSKVKFDDYVASGRVLHNYANILELLLRLRQCCNHPFLVMSRADAQHWDLRKLSRRFLEASDSPDQDGPSSAYVEEVMDNFQNGENTECPICMEVAEDPVITPCAHRMCKECLLASWRTPTTGLCPMCRTQLRNSDLIVCSVGSEFDAEKNWKNSSKVSKLVECLLGIRKSGSGQKSVVFSQWTCFLDLLEISLKQNRIGFHRFDGSLPQKRREHVLREFNESQEKMVLLMSLKAGGVGLNLTSASNVFIMDPWWNPAVEEQAIMRIHRIGQKNTVRVRRFIVKDTVEERLQLVQAKKQRMIAGALTDEEVRSARIEELKMLFR